MYVSGSMFEGKTKMKSKKMGGKGLQKGNPEGFEGGEPSKRPKTNVKAANSKMKLQSAKVDANKKKPKKGHPKKKG